MVPAFSTSDRVQLLLEQVQPVPDIEANVRPVGTASLTVTAPLVGAEPMLATVTV